MLEAKPKILGIIPARYGSTRFPGKPLAMIHGKTMIQCVYDRAIQAKSLDAVIVATDNVTILGTFEGHACLTMQHETGTDRCAEVLSYVKEKFDYVINIQGDQPFIQPEQIDLLAQACDGETEIATLVKKIDNDNDFLNTNVVKALISGGKARWFTREAENNPSPPHIPTLKHLGIYAYRTDILAKIAKLPVSAFEKAESLEQMRWLENGYKIKCIETSLDSPSIDTPEDLCELLKTLK